MAVPVSYQTQRNGRLAMTALGFAVGSFCLLFVAYIGWLADVVVGPIAFAVAVAAVVRALIDGVDRRLAFGSLAVSIPALAWAIYAMAGGQF